MQKWEYATALVAYPDVVNKTAIKAINGSEQPDWKGRTLWEGLSALGDQGWELVAIHWAQHNDPIYIFKRPRIE